MGIFDPKKTTTVHTQIQRVIEDDALPDTIRVSLIRAIMDESEEASVPEHLINGFANSLALKIDRLYSWAETNYTYGLVESDITSNRDGEAVAKALVESALGETITVDYFEFGPINWLHVGWMKLISDHAYNPVTNELEDLTTSVGFPCYLDDLEVVFTEVSYEEQTMRSLEQWGIPQQSGVTTERPANLIIGEYYLPSPVVTLDTATYDHVLVTYAWRDVDNVLQRDTFEIALTGYDDDTLEYYHMKYRYNDGVDDHIVYWLYENGSDLEPSMEAIHDFPFAEVGSYLPMVHFRNGNDNLGAVAFEGTPDFESSVELMKLFGMDYQSLCTSFDDNPDINDLEQILMMVAVDIDDSTEVGMRYLYDHFNYLWTIGGSSISWRDPVPNGARFSQILQDRDFKMSFRHGGISKRSLAGNIAAVGKHARETVTVYAPKKKKGISGGIQTIITEFFSDNCYVFRRQITPQVYDEIKVYRPGLTYHIYGSKTFLAGFSADALLIPVDYNILETYALPERELLLARAMHFVYNTRIVSKTEWYQTTAFKAILMIAAVVVTIYTGIDFISQAMIAYQAGAVVLAELLITNIIIGIAIQQGLQLLVSVVGTDLAMILAAVGTVVALSYGPNGFASGVKGAPWADELLQVSSGMTKAVDSEVADMAAELEKNAKRFGEYAAEQDKLLKQSQDLLKTSTLINPFEFVAQVPFSIYGEKPQDYYSRTIHSGNVGIQGINAISGYVGMALKLPTIHETFGETEA